MSITVEEVESEMGAGAYRDDDGNVSIDFETFSRWWKKHESSPRDDDIVYTGYVLRLYSG